jgi:predicted transcriptional regulator
MNTIIDAPHNGTPTSIAAAESVVEVTGALRIDILGFIDRPEGATCDEVEEALGLRHQTASARINELAHRFQRIAPHGTRATRSGRKATVWTVVPVWAVA